MSTIKDEIKMALRGQMLTHQQLRVKLREKRPTLSANTLSATLSKMQRAVEIYKSQGVWSLAPHLEQRLSADGSSG